MILQYEVYRTARRFWLCCQAPITRFFGSKPMATLGSIAFPMFILHLSQKNVSAMLPGEATALRLYCVMCQAWPNRSDLLQKGWGMSQAVTDMSFCYHADTRKEDLGWTNVNEVLPVPRSNMVLASACEKVEEKVVPSLLGCVAKPRCYLLICLALSHLTNEARQQFGQHVQAQDFRCWRDTAEMPDRPTKRQQTRAYRGVLREEQKGCCGLRKGSSSPCRMD